MTPTQRRRLHVIHKSMLAEPAIKARFPVRLRIMALTRAGDCELVGKGSAKHYLIRLDSRLTFGHAFMVLLHEWAHAAAWLKDHPDHGPEWGVMHATIWRLMVDWL